MKGRAPNSPLTGSQACLKKKPMPNFDIDNRERMINSTRISPTMAKMTSAQTTMSPAKALSTVTELPRDCRNFRICETSAGGFFVPGPRRIGGIEGGAGTGSTGHANVLSVEIHRIPN